MNKPKRVLAVAFTIFAVLSITESAGIQFFETGDPEYNTTAPLGELSNSGWELQGEWGNFLGTPVGPNHFITAAHVGGAVGQEFLLNGVGHVTTARHVDSGSDLALWEVTPRFSVWAELYQSSDEVGKRLVVFGRGTQRGPAIQVNDVLGLVTKGWKWGVSDHRKRWGENKVEEIADADGNPYSLLFTGTAVVGTFLRASFDSNGGPNEAHLSAGDSGGGVFIQDGALWKLAGLNLGVDGPYNTSGNGSGFFGAIFDEGGLYKGGEGRWALTPDLPSSQGGAFFATRISSRVEWIQSIIGQPGPPPEPVLEWASAVGAVFEEDSTADFDPVNMLIRTSNSGQQRFYRIRASDLMEITGFYREENQLVIRCRYR